MTKSSLYTINDAKKEADWFGTSDIMVYRCFKFVGTSFRSYINRVILGKIEERPDGRWSWWRKDCHDNDWWDKGLPSQGVALTKEEAMMEVELGWIE